MSHDVEIKWRRSPPSHDGTPARYYRARRSHHSRRYATITRLWGKVTRGCNYYISHINTIEYVHTRSATWGSAPRDAHKLIQKKRVTRYSGKPEVSFACVRYTWHACSGNLTQTQVHASVVSQTTVPLAQSTLTGTSLCCLL